MTSYGKHEGDLPGAPRTGHDLKMTSITIHRIAGESLSRSGRKSDVVGFLIQIVRHAPARGSTADVRVWIPVIDGFFGVDLSQIGVIFHGPGLRNQSQNGPSVGRRSRVV